MGLLKSFLGAFGRAKLLLSRDSGYGSAGGSPSHSCNPVNTLETGLQVP